MLIIPDELLFEERAFTRYRKQGFNGVNFTYFINIIKIAVRTLDKCIFNIHLMINRVLGYFLWNSKHEFNRGFIGTVVHVNPVSVFISDYGMFHLAVGKVKVLQSKLIIHHLPYMEIIIIMLGMYVSFDWHFKNGQL